MPGATLRRKPPAARAEAPPTRRNPRSEGGGALSREAGEGRGGGGAVLPILPSVQSVGQSAGRRADPAPPAGVHTPAYMNVAPAGAWFVPPEEKDPCLVATD
jgi:hypothetical protein